MFGLRFDFRNPPIGGTSAADRYAGGIDMAEWADNRGGIAVSVSEHHGSPDGYLPSPLPLVAAMASRTATIRFTVAALIAPFYDTLRLAEDLAVLDHLSRGRVDLIIGAGYVRSEFEMYGDPMTERTHRVTETVKALKEAFTGEPFEFRGRTVRVTPAPFRKGGPALILGGSSDAAARRAARIADGFLPTVAGPWDAYRDEMAKLGKADPGPCPIGEHVTVALADDPERAWKQMGPFFLHETNAYGHWLAENDSAGPYRVVEDVKALRAGGQYRVLTPEQYVADLKTASFPFAMLHPLCGGMPPELAWSSLRLFEQRVLPAFADP